MPRLPELKWRMQQFLTPQRIAGGGGLAVLCATSLAALTPAAGGPGLALVLGSMGLNVLASVIQQFFQDISSQSAGIDEQVLNDLTRTLETQMASSGELRSEIGKFLAEQDAVRIAEEIIRGNPVAHSGLLIAIYKDLTRYHDDFEALDKKLDETLRKLDGQQLGVPREQLSTIITDAWGVLARSFGSSVQSRTKTDGNNNQVAELPVSLDSIMGSLILDIRRRNPERIADVRSFLVSPELKTIALQLYAAIMENSLPNYRANVQRELSLMIERHTGLDADTTSLATHLFDLLLTSCDRTLTRAIEKGMLVAHEARSQLRYHFLLDQLSAIEKNIDLLLRQQRADVEAILQFEEAYRGQVAQRHSTLMPPSLDALRPVPIDDLYVSPLLVRSRKELTQQERDLDLPAFRSILYRAVLLGNPGGGKSTFSRKLCYDLSTRYSEGLLGGRSVTPILVILRDYGSMKRTHNCSIVEHIKAVSASHYQLRPPQGAFDYLLLNGRAVVIFDGLDELLNTRDRQEISADVESFCNLYPAVPVLVTSREVGYDQAPLNEQRFEVLRLAPFTDEKVEEYVAKWFKIESALVDDERKEKVAAFMRESEAVQDLRSNPLLLGLMCNLYRGEGYIPSNRPDLYEKCANLLFERWDRSRDINLSPASDPYTRYAMMHLAYWIYTTGALKEGVTESQLIRETTNYLCPRRYEDPIEAERAAQELVEFCRGRAWVFTDMGTTSEGVRLYQFTHRTFMEYFTAAYLVRTHSAPDQLLSIILPRIADEEWDVVAQLAFQIMNKQVEGAGDYLLSALLKPLFEANRAQTTNLISFAARCLTFMIPSPSVRRAIATACIENTFSYITDIDPSVGYATWDKSLHDKLPNVGQKLIGSLLIAAPENFPTLEDHIEKLLVGLINDAKEHEAAVAAEIGVHLPSYILLMDLDRRISEQAQQVQVWAKVTHRILDNCTERIMALSQKHLIVCVHATAKGLISPAKMAQWHGVSSLFKSTNFTAFPGMFFTPLAPLHLLRFMMDMDREASEKDIVLTINQLRDLGDILLSFPPPWIVENFPLSFKVSGFLPYITRYATKKLTQSDTAPNRLWDHRSFWAFLVLLAAAFEGLLAMDEIQPDDLEALVKSSDDTLWDPLMRGIFLGRLGLGSVIDIRPEMNHHNFTHEQQSFILRWISQEINLVELPKRHLVI